MLLHCFVQHLFLGGSRHSEERHKPCPELQSANVLIGSVGVPTPNAGLDHSGCSVVLLSSHTSSLQTSFGTEATTENMSRIFFSRLGGLVGLTNISTPRSATPSLDLFAILRFCNTTRNMGLDAEFSIQVYKLVGSA